MGNAARIDMPSLELVLVSLETLPNACRFSGASMPASLILCLVSSRIVIGEVG